MEKDSIVISVIIKGGGTLCIYVATVVGSFGRPVARGGVGGVAAPPLKKLMIFITPTT